MTTILMKETKKGVKIAYDSQVTTGSRKGALDFDKVFVNNDVIYGVAGAVRDANILRYANLPSIPDSEWDVDKWVTVQLIPAMMAILTDQHAAEYQNQQIYSENHCLVAVRNRVYRISGNFGWVRNPDGIYAVGSGSDYALGALWAGATLESALLVAAALDSYTGQTLKLTTSMKLLGGK